MQPVRAVVIVGAVRALRHGIPDPCHAGGYGRKRAARLEVGPGKREAHHRDVRAAAEEPRAADEDPRIRTAVRLRLEERRMTQIVPLDKEAHRTLKVDGRASAAYGDNQHFVQVIVSEFPHLVVRYPILFAKHVKTGQFYCGAILGFDEGENLFLDEWRERETYRPLALQRMPFYVHGPEIAIDLDHPRVGAEAGQPLFDHAGK